MPTMSLAMSIVPSLAASPRAWGKLLASVADATLGETLVAHLRDSSVQATVQNVSATPKPEDDGA